MKLTEILKEDRKINRLDLNPNDLDSIKNSVCKALKINPKKLKSKSRLQSLVYARFIYFHFAKKITNLSLSEIGQSVNMDHSSVIHGLKQAENKFNSRLQDKLKQVEGYL
jgi:chromosomal replication initiation ATPase DnaA